MDLTDAAVVGRARAGDADAFREIVERHGRALFRLAFLMTGNQQDAEDVVRESFLRAYRQFAGFDQRASFGTHHPAAGVDRLQRAFYPHQRLWAANS